MKKLTYIQSLLLFLFLVPFCSVAQPPSVARLIEGENYLEYTIENENIGGNFYYDVYQPNNKTVEGKRVKYIIINGIQYEANHLDRITLSKINTEFINIKEVFSMDYDISGSLVKYRRDLFFNTQNKHTYYTNIFVERMKIDITFSMEVTQFYVHAHNNISFFDKSFNGSLYLEFQDLNSDVINPQLGTSYTYTQISDGFFEIEVVNGEYECFLTNSTISKNGYIANVYQDAEKSKLILSSINNPNLDNVINIRSYSDFFNNDMSISANTLLYHEFELVPDLFSPQAGITQGIQLRDYYAPLNKIYEFNIGEEVTELNLQNKETIPFSYDELDDDYNFIGEWGKKYLFEFAPIEQLYQEPFGTLLGTLLIGESGSSAGLGIYGDLYFTNNSYSFDIFSENDKSPDNDVVSIDARSMLKDGMLNQTEVLITFSNNTPVNKKLNMSNILLTEGNLLESYVYLKGQKIILDDFFSNYSDIIVEPNEEILFKLHCLSHKIYGNNITTENNVLIDFIELKPNGNNYINVPESKIEYDFKINANFLTGYTLSEDNCHAIDLQFHEIEGMNILLFTLNVYDKKYLDLNSNNYCLTSHNHYVFSTYEEIKSVPLFSFGMPESINETFLNISVIFEIDGVEYISKNDYDIDISSLNDYQKNYIYPPYTFNIENPQIIPGSEINLRSDWDFTTTFDYADYSNPGENIMSPGNANLEILPYDFEGDELGAKMYYEYGGDKCYVYDKVDVELAQLGITINETSLCPFDEFNPELYIGSTLIGEENEIESISWELVNASTGDALSSVYISGSSTISPTVTTPNVDAKLVCHMKMKGVAEEMTAETTIPLYADAPSLVSTPTVTNASCKNSSDGAVEIISNSVAVTIYDENGNVVPASVTGSDPYTVVATNLAQGNYGYEAVSGDCSFNSSFTIGNDAPPIVAYALVQESHTETNKAYVISGVKARHITDPISFNVENSAGATVCSFTFSNTDEIIEDAPNDIEKYANSTKSCSNPNVTYGPSSDQEELYVVQSTGECIGQSYNVYEFSARPSISTTDGLDYYEFCGQSRNIDVSVSVGYVPPFIHDLHMDVYYLTESGTYTKAKTIEHALVYGTYNIKVPVIEGENKYRVVLYHPNEGSTDATFMNKYYSAECHFTAVFLDNIEASNVKIETIQPNCNNELGMLEAIVDKKGCGTLTYMWKDGTAANANFISNERVVYNVAPHTYYLTLAVIAEDGTKMLYENIANATINEPTIDFTINRKTINGCEIPAEIHANTRNTGSNFTIQWYYSETAYEDIKNNGVPVFAKEVQLTPDSYYTSEVTTLSNDDLNSIDITKTTVYNPYGFKSLKEGYYAFEVTDSKGCSKYHESIELHNIKEARNYTLNLRWAPAKAKPFPLYTSDGDEIETETDPFTPIIEPPFTLNNDEHNVTEDCGQDILENERVFVNSIKANINDWVEVAQSMDMGYFTLYYYDRVGNLVKTVPPKGVKTVSNKTDIPEHEYVSEYKYNTLGQLVWQKTPDGGESNFVYDLLGRLLFSQNAQQATENKFSYSKYDRLGRVVEAGEATFGGIANDGSTIQTLPNLKTYALGYITQNGLDYYSNNPDEIFPTTHILSKTTTTYNNATPGINLDGKVQRNLRNRVASVHTTDENGFESSIYYSYDIHGNVIWIANDVPEMGMTYIEYDYDLISGNVKQVILHAGDAGKFYHKYEYDEDNRLKNVATSFDGEVWNTEAEYDYYKHGPLRSVVLGNEQVQEMNYRYTIQGWLKAINSNIHNVADGAIPKDAFAMTLGYYDGDFVRSGSDDLNGNTSGAEKEIAQNMDLFGGNIATWTWTSPNSSADLETKAFDYSYDYLQRIKGATFNTSNGTSFTASTAFGTEYSYDLNGNLQTLTRKDKDGQNMDVLAYTYDDQGAGALKNNKLLSVSDAVQNSSNEDDFEELAEYGYDEIGNLKADPANGIQNIVWNASGKIQEIIPIKNPDKQKPHILFVYDAMGNRIMKQVNSKPTFFADGSLNSYEYSDVTQVKTTYYVRDAQGNIMANFLRSNEDRTGSRSLSFEFACNDPELPMAIEYFFKPSKIVVPPALDYLDDHMIDPVNPKLILNFDDGTSQEIIYNTNTLMPEDRFFDGKEYSDVVWAEFTITGSGCSAPYGTIDAGISIQLDNSAEIRLTELPIYGSSRLGILNESKLFGTYSFVSNSASKYSFHGIEKIESEPEKEIGADKLLIPQKEYVELDINGKTEQIKTVNFAELNSEHIDNVSPTSSFGTLFEKQTGLVPRFTASISKKGQNPVHAVVVNSGDIQVYGSNGRIPLPEYFYEGKNTQVALAHVPKSSEYFLINTYSGNIYTGVANAVNTRRNAVQIMQIDPLANNGNGVIKHCGRGFYISDGNDNHNLTGAIVAGTYEKKHKTVIFALAKQNTENMGCLYRMADGSRSLIKIWGTERPRVVLDAIPMTSDHGTLLRISPDGTKLAILYPSSKAQGIFDCRKHSIMIIPLGEGFTLGRLEEAISYELPDYVNSNTISMEFSSNSKFLHIGQEKMTTGGSTIDDFVLKTFSVKHMFMYGYSNEGGQFVRNASGALIQVRDGGSISEHYEKTLISYGNEINIPSGSTSVTGISAVGNSLVTFYDNEDPYTLGSIKLGQRNYELSDHLGNVRVVLTDRKSDSDSDGVYEYQLVQSSDYYPFGMQIQGLSYTNQNNDYRFGFQGQEKDDEIKGAGNSINYKYRMHDPRIGRFFAVDPLAAKYPQWSPYQFSGNQVIATIELEGLEPLKDYNDYSTQLEQYAMWKESRVETVNMTYTFDYDPNAADNYIEYGSHWYIPVNQTSGSYTDYNEQLSDEPVEQTTFNVTVKIPYINSIWTRYNVNYKIYTAQVTSLDQLSDPSVWSEKIEPNYLKAFSEGVVNGAFVGFAQVTSNIPRQKTGQFYTCAYETKLSPNSYPGKSRYIHEKEANMALAAEMKANKILGSMNIKVPRSPKGTILGGHPDNYVWHHDTRRGVMQLVPKSQHPDIPGGIFWNTMHPNGAGGYSIWGKN